MSIPVRLHAVGYWQSPEAGFAFPRPQELSGAEWVVRDLERVVNFLQLGRRLLTTCCGKRYYYPNDQEELAVESDYLTDGNYVWPASLSFYLAKYRIRLPNHFVQNCLNSNLNLEAIDRIDTDDFSISTVRWFRWCRHMRANRLFALLSYFDAPRGTIEDWRLPYT